MSSSAKSLPEAGTHQVLARLCEVIEAETTALQSRQWKSLDDFCRSKARMILELRRLSSDAAVRPDDIDRLQTALTENQAALQLHLQAATEVSRMITDMVQAQESDGTYSSSIAFRERS